MNAADRGVRAYELTVEGAIGPVLRAALPTHRVRTQAPCTVLRLEGDAGPALGELLDRLAAADVTVQEIRRLQ